MAALSLVLADEEDEDEEEEVFRCGAAAVTLGTLERRERSIFTRRFFRPRLDTVELFSLRPYGTRV